MNGSAACVRAQRDDGPSNPPTILADAGNCFQIDIQSSLPTHELEELEQLEELEDFEELDGLEDFKELDELEDFEV